MIVRSTIELGHNMGLRVVAEGVEDERSWAVLKELGCDLGQGFHFTRPVASEAFEQWLAASEWGQPREAEAPGLPAESAEGDGLRRWSRVG